MDYYAGLDVSLEKTYICVLDRKGAIITEAMAVSTPGAIAEALDKTPARKLVVFETRRPAGERRVEPGEVEGRMLQRQFCGSEQ